MEIICLCGSGFLYIIPLLSTANCARYPTSQMEIMNDMQTIPDPSWVLRIFNGLLQGCEFTLTQPRTLFVVGSAEYLRDNQQPLCVPSDALYIPLEQGGCNFEVLISDTSISGVTLRILSEPNVQERLCNKQTLEHVGGLRFALRPAAEPWDAALLGTLDEALPAATGNGARPAPIWLGVFAGLAALAVVTGGWYVSRPNPVTDIHALVDGSSADFTVLQGRDHTLYAFASSERDASWGRHVLERSHYKPATKVLNPLDEQKRLQQLVVRAEPGLAWHGIDLSDPAQPRLLISNQRNLLTPTLQQRLTNLLREAAPYARDVEILGRDDQQLSGAAEQGLKRLGLPYSKTVQADSVTFTLQGALQDAELQAAREYISGFTRQWGDRYVHFVVELHDDWLKGKSFQYGPQGYVKMAPASWYFPKPI